MAHLITADTPDRYIHHFRGRNPPQKLWQGRRVVWRTRALIVVVGRLVYPR